MNHHVWIATDSVQRNLLDEGGENNGELSEWITLDAVGLEMSLLLRDLVNCISFIGSTYPHQKLLSNHSHVGGVFKIVKCLRWL